MNQDSKLNGGASVGTKEVLAANKAKMERQRILGAHVGLDICMERGEMCRGAYIVDELGIFYATHEGTWTHGVKGDSNWWKDKTEAGNFLAAMQVANSRTERPAVVANQN